MNLSKKFKFQIASNYFLCLKIHLFIAMTVTFYVINKFVAFIYIAMSILILFFWVIAAVITKIFTNDHSHHCEGIFIASHPSLITSEH